MASFDQETLSRLRLAIEKGMNPDDAMRAAQLYQQKKAVMQPIQSQTSTQPKKKGLKLTDLLPAAGAVGAGLIAAPFTAGASLPVALGIAGLAGGAGSALGEAARQNVEGEDLDVGRIGKEAAFGLAGGAAGEGVGRAVQFGARLAKGGAQATGKLAANSVLNTTPSAYEKAGQVGIDLTKTYQKYAPALGTSYEQMLGKVGSKGGGTIASLIDEAEKSIQGTVNAAGKTIKISGDDIIKGLKAEAKVLGQELGAGNKRVALDAIIKEAEKKYAKGITTKQALSILRQANAEFGRAILDDAGDAVAKSAVKLEANTLRTTLKRLFPDLANALDAQHELITLREVLTKAASKEGVDKFNLALNPLTLLDKAPNVITRNPSVASKLSQIGIEGGEQATRNAVIDTGKQVLGKSTAQGAVRLFDSSGTNITPEDGMLPGGLLSQDQILSPTEEAGGISKEDLAKVLIADLAVNKGKNIASISAIGKLLLPEKKKTLSAAQQKDVANASSGLRAVSVMEKELSRDPSVVLRSRVPGAPGARVFNTALREAQDVITRLRTGAQINEYEEQFYRGQLPSVFDDEETIQYKLGLFRDLFSRIAQTAQSESETGALDTDALSELLGL